MLHLLDIPPDPSIVADRLPSAPGSYLLLFHLAAPLPMLAVGRLGRFDLPAGSWIYCGSAWGIGGLRARIGRHLRREKCLHWHVDYLVREVRPIGVLFCLLLLHEGKLECEWRHSLQAADHSLVAPIQGFGSSDCRNKCPAHLLYTPAFLAGRDLAQRIKEGQ